MRDFSTLKKRILEYIKYKGISKTKFYKLTGISNGILSQKNGITEDNLMKFLSTFNDLNTEWFFRGVGPIEKRTEIQHYYSKNREKNVEVQLIPFYDIDTTVGLSLFMQNQKLQALDYFIIPGLPRCDGAIRVTGDSMHPLLKGGDIIFYKITNKENIFWGEMYVLGIDLNGDQIITIKYVQKSEFGKEYVKLVSQNSHHQPVDIHVDNIITIAIVKASLRFNSTI
ncbi:MAG: S24 family peptidase [Chitinophagaceae bacterium]|nr:S24 family peptidase [Chitinophagaceae bacterium]